MSSLKRKIESALLQVVAAGGFTGQRIRSDEERITTLRTPSVVAYYSPQGRTSSGAIERGLLLLSIKSSADTAEPTGDNPAPTSAELLHAQYVQQVRQAVYVADFASVLTQKSLDLDEPISVLQALPSAPPDPDPESGNFIFVFAWETAAIDQDCT